MAIVHEIVLDRYSPIPARLTLGTNDSYGVEQLHLIPGAGWEDLSMVATWHPPGGADPVQILASLDGVVDVPAEATALAGDGLCVIAGLADGVRLLSCSIAYRVMPQAGYEGKEAAEPTPDLVQQVVTAANKATEIAESVRADADKMTEAETTRTEAESARESAESARKAAESARDQAEQQRESAEEARGNAENKRAASEQSRVEAENARQDAEAARAQAESERKANESTRQQTESERQAAEQIRTSEESTRKAAESTRQQEESTRQGNESTRERAESSRETAEQNRVSAESSRTNAESARATAEQARKTGEDTRVAAEQNRESAEADRVKAETARVEAEKQRVEEFDGMKEQLAGMVDSILLEALFRLPRTGKVYTVKIPKYAANQTTVCEKLDDNAGLVCEPSTDTVEGQDDYADIPLFRWYNCNYKRDKYGHAYPTAIEGLSEDYATEGNIDIGVIQMAPYIKWDSSNDDYIILSITDSPKDGYTLWYTAKSNGTSYPYVIHSKCFSSLGDDGLPRSIFDRKPIRNESHNNLITEYGKKGEGYYGAKAERNTWQIVFTLIKYAVKSSQAKFAGCTGYSYQYSASVQRTEKLTYFPATNAQATNLAVGSGVSVGYGYISNDAISLNRDNANLYKYADDVKILKIEDLGDGNSAVYLDCEPFDTTPVALSDTLSAPITLSTMHWHGGATNSVIGHHDGSPGSNTDGKHPYRVQGLEYAVGGYVVTSDVEIMFTDGQTTKNVLVCPPGTKNTSSEATIRETHANVGEIPGGDYWIGDIEMDVEHCVTWPSTKGGGNSVGVGDYNYGGGTAVAANALREHLICGCLWNGSYAGSSFLSSWDGLGNRWWGVLAAD